MSSVDHKNLDEIFQHFKKAVSYPNTNPSELCQTRPTKTQSRLYHNNPQSKVHEPVHLFISIFITPAEKGVTWVLG